MNSRKTGIMQAENGISLSSGSDKANKKNLNFEVLTDYLHTYNLIYLVLLGLIAVLELAMMVRGLFQFDFTKWYRVLYFCSYVILFIASAGTFAAVLVNRLKGGYDRLLAYLNQIYSSIIILWAGLISYIDLTTDKTPIVYLTVIICVAAVMNVFPVLYSLEVIPVSFILIIVAYQKGALLTQSSGYLINFSVFVLFSVLLVFIQFRQHTKSYIAKAKLEHLSYFDQLTGVYNRHSLRDHIANSPKNTLFYFGIIDVDNFKSVNDTFGHDVGDACLRDIAILLRRNFGDSVYRYGGDEFVVITSMREGDLAPAITQVNQGLSSRYPGKEIHISGGFYCPVSDEEQYRDYFKKADRALYVAKTTGKSKTVVYKEPN